MLKFECENQELEKVLQELYSLVIENGGYLNDSITIVEKQGELSIHSSLPADNQDELISLPDSCLPCIDDFDITIDNDVLAATPRSEEIMNSHVNIMSMIIQIYNLTNKLGQHRLKNPWLALAKTPKILTNLFEGRSNAPKIAKHYKKFLLKKYDELLIDTFIGSRTIGFKSHDNDKATQRLMPFIDFINHHFNSPSFQTSRGEEKTISINNSLPIASSSECFVRYNMMDAHDSFLVYGFVDTSSPFIRSKPLQFTIRELGGLVIHSRNVPPHKGELPTQVKDLRRLMPNVLKFTAEELHLSHLIIPGENSPKALRRVLEFIIRTLKPQLDSNVVNSMVKESEEYIVTENIKYYENLGSTIDTIQEGYISEEIINSMKTLVDIQLKKLRAYQKRAENLD